MEESSINCDDGLDDGVLQSTHNILDNDVQESSQYCKASEKGQPITAPCPCVVIDDLSEDSVSLTGLHELYRQCLNPLAVYEDTHRLLAQAAPVNYVDDSGCTPLSLLVLHVNRGLRYHQYRVLELATLEDHNAAKQEITKTCVQIDTKYQSLISDCLKLLLDQGADVNIIPGTCPGIAYDSQWSETYEHKIMQSDQRWNLFTIGGSMEFTTYNIFNPLSAYRPVNTKSVTILHVAAWRGAADCMEMLIKHGADVHAITSDSRNALHFLYLYCNCPDDLVKATSLLIQNGINCTLPDHNGNTPLLLLLNHYLVKRSHVKYMANSYTECNIVDLPMYQDHYREEMRRCIELLLEAGVTLDPVDRYEGVSPLHHLYHRLEHSLSHCEPDFQVKGHYLVPYYFTLYPVIEMSRFLIAHRCKVGIRGCLGTTALHRLVLAVRNLSLDERLNPTSDLEKCFSILLAENINVNAKDHVGKTTFHHLVQIIVSTRFSLPRYLGVLRLLLTSGADLTTQDNNGNTVLHLVLASSMKAEDLQELLVFLLQHGADPNQASNDGKYALNNLMRQHLHHHDHLSIGSASLRLDHYLHSMDTICHMMSPSILAYVFSVYRESGFWGVICESECRVYQLLHKHSTGGRSLRDSARMAIWRSMGARYMSGVKVLPIPEQIKQYLLQLVT